MRLTNDTLVFQHVLPNSGCIPWLALTAPRTLDYCLKYQMDYRMIVGDVDPGKDQFGHWSVPHLIREFLKTDYKNIIYLDADTIIADFSVDLREACKLDKIGAVWHNLSYHDPDWSHFNVGALYISNTKRIQEFAEKWIAGYPGTRDFPWWEQGVFGIVGSEMGIINHLDNRWNAGHVSPSDHPVVLGLHGFPDRYEAMKEALKKLGNENGL